MAFTPSLQDRQRLDIDSVVLPLQTLSVLTAIRDSHSLAVVKNCAHKLKDVKDLIYIADVGGYGLYGRASQQQKEAVCQYIYRHHIGPRLFPALKDNCFFTSTSRLSLQALVDALQDSGVTSVCLVVYGQKQPLSQVDHLKQIRINRLVPTRFDIGFEAWMPFIPTFTTTHGKTYPMFLKLGKGGGSLKFTVSGTTVKVYPVIMHVVKSSIRNFGIPKTLMGVKKKVEQIKRYVREVRHTHHNMLCGFRMEVCVIGDYTLSAATRVAQSIFASYQNYGIVIRAAPTPTEYITNLEATISMSEGHFRGNNSGSPTDLHKFHLAQIFNATGYWSGFWARYLEGTPPANIVTANVRTMSPQVQRLAPPVLEIFDNMAVRNPPSNRNLLCGIKKRSGACTKPFPTLNQLATHVYDTYGDSWRDHVTVKPASVESRLVRPEEDIHLFNDLLRPFEMVLGPPIYQLPLDDITYATFNVPNTDDCFFLCASAALQQHLQHMPSTLQLKSVLSDFYRVTVTSDQVSYLESKYNTSLLQRHHDISNPSCRGKQIDMHALACIYNVTFQLVQLNLSVSSPTFRAHTYITPIMPSTSIVLNRLIVRTDTTDHYIIAIPLTR